MTTEVQAMPVAGDTGVHIHWRSIIAGAIAASALALVLHGFAGSIGISISSTAPTWRDASFALILLSGLYLLLVSLASYSFGAYVAARLHAPMLPGDATEFHDGMHGLLVWALATLLTGLLAIAVLHATPRLAAPAGSAPSTSIAGENIIAYDLDRLFRADRRPQINMDYIRSEAARILLTAPSHRGLQPDDRGYLIRLVAGATGLAPPDAERRVDDVIARAKENVSRARRVAVVLGFMLSAAALIGAIAAWYAACAAGRHRDGREVLSPLWDWGRPYSRY